MKNRSWKKFLSFLLASTMVFTMNTAVFADNNADSEKVVAVEEGTAVNKAADEETVQNASENEEDSGDYNPEIETETAETLGEATDEVSDNDTLAPQSELKTMDDEETISINQAYAGTDNRPFVLSDGTWLMVKGGKFAYGSDLTTTDKKIVTVKKGVVQAKKEGEATLSGAGGTVKVKVIVPTIEKKVNLSVGDLKDLTLNTGIDEKEEVKIDWSSSNTEVAQVYQGTVQAVGVGSATISAWLGGKAYKSKVKVTEAAGKEINMYLRSGKKRSPKGKDYKNGMQVVSGSSATVNGTKIVASSPGKTVISSGNGSKINVYVESPSYTPSLSLKVGERALLYSDDVHELPAWKSSKSTVASVSEFGVVSAETEGKSKISAKIAGQTVKVAVTVSGTADENREADESGLAIVALDPMNGNTGITVEVDDNGDVGSEIETQPDDDPVNPDTKTYTVTFDTDGGSEVPSQKVKSGEKATKPEDPKKEGFIFDGWTLDGAAFSFDNAITANIILKAVWKTSIAVTSVSLNNTAPKVGDTITATVSPNNASNVASYEWLLADKADGTFTAIEGQTSASLDIKADYVGKFLKVVAIDADGNRFESPVSEAITNAEDVVVSKLEATGSKELTATLSKEAAGLTTKDFTIKKGNVTLTPADLTVDGTTVKITLGSKIVKDTYSVAYRETTPATVETEDEKLVEFVTVGTAFAQISDAESDRITGGGTDAADGNSTTVNASIEYQAKNQYGENISAEILQVSNTFGGKVYFTEPNAKKNGTIVVYDVPAALGIQGTKGNLIIVSKDGVSNTCEVEMSEAAKVKSIALKGIYNIASSAYVEAIPAQKAATNFVLVIDAKDQYDRPINGTNLYQTASIAQMLTNVTVDGIGADGKLTADSFTTIEIDGVEETALKLKTSDDAVAKAGTVKVIVVGDRFGSVMDETITVSQIDLIKSFSFSAKDTVYNKYDNEMDFTATSVEGKEVTDYDTLNKLVDIASDTGVFKWQKQTDGSAKLFYTPGVAEGAGDILDASATSTNLKQSTVTSATATINADISAADQIVVPKTFTVYEKKVPYSIVKYTGDTVSTATTINIERKKFVIEDQYGNTMTNADTTLAGASIDYMYTGTGVSYATANIPANDAANANISGGTFTISPAAQKLYVSIAPYARDDKATLATFNKDKAQATLSLQQVDATKVTNLKAVWNSSNLKGDVDVDGDGDDYETDGDTDDKFYVPATMAHILAPNQATSGVTADDFEVTGTVNGKTITLVPGDDYTIKTDSYVPITLAEFETAVKTATVVMTVKVTDDEGNQSTEEVSCDYEYSGAAEKIEGIKSVAALQGKTSQAYAVADTGDVDTSELGDFFVTYDQYGEVYYDATVGNSAAPTFEVSLGDKTASWKVVDNNMKACNITNAVAATAGSDFSVTATLPDGKSAVVKVIADATAGLTTLETAATTKCGAVYTAYHGITFDSVAGYNALASALDDAEEAIAAFVAAGGSTADLDATNSGYAEYEAGVDKMEAIDTAITAAKAVSKAQTMAADTSIADIDAAETGLVGLIHAARTDTTPKATYTTANLVVGITATSNIAADATTGSFSVKFIDGSTVTGYTLATAGTGKYSAAIASGETTIS